jgi:hypothetical protein
MMDAVVPAGSSLPSSAPVAYAQIVSMTIPHIPPRTAPPKRRPHEKLRADIMFRGVRGDGEPRRPDS